MSHIARKAFFLLGLLFLTGACGVESAGLPQGGADPATMDIDDDVLPGETPETRPRPGSADEPSPPTPSMRDAGPVDLVPESSRVDAAAAADANSPPVAMDAGPAADAAAPLDSATPADASPTTDPNLPTGPVDGEERQQRCPQDRKDLVLCLRFEGDVNDDSDEEHRLEARAVGYDAGPAGLAASLGTDSLLLVPESPALDVEELTIEAWINPQFLPGPGQRMGIVDNDGQYGFFLLPNGGLSCTAGGAVSVPAGIRAGTWTSVACTRDRGRVALWVGGKRVAESAATGPISRHARNGTRLGGNNPQGDPFEGLLDNVRIWGRALTAGDLCQAALGCR